MRLCAVIIMVLTGGLVSCATKYQPTGFKGGYKDIKLQEDVYRVTSGGNAYTSTEKVQVYALYRAAELTLENGCDYFIIQNQDNDRTYGSYSTPSTTNTTGSFHATSTGRSTFGSVNTSSYSYGGNTYSYSKDSSTLTIRVFKGKKPASNPNAYDARELKESLQSSYKELQPKTKKTR